MNAEEHLKNGKTYLNQNDLDQAIAEFTEALRLDPNLAAAKGNLTAAYYNRGVRSFRNGDSDRAIADLTEAAALTPNDTDIYAARGMIYGKKGNHDGAINDFTEAIRLAPKTISFYHSRAGHYCDKRNEYLAKGDDIDYFKYLDLAIKDLEDGLKIVPANDVDTELQTNMREWLESAKRERKSRKGGLES